MAIITATKKEYKQNKLSLIPKGWNVEKLPTVCWFQEGPGLRNWQFTNSGMKVINVTNLENGYLNLSKTRRHISIEEFQKMYRHFEIDDKDIVVASSGNSYAKIAVVRKQDLPLVMNTSVIRFKPLKNMDYGYLLVFLKSHFFKDQIDLLITGGAQPNFGPFHLNRIKILFPHLKQEQENIAKVILNTDELIEQLEKLIEKKKAIKQSTMQQLLTGKKRLPGFNGKWKLEKLEDIGDISGSGVDKKIRQDEMPVRLLNYLDVYHNNFIFAKNLNHWVTTSISQFNRCNVQKGDIFFTPSSETRDDIAFSCVAMENMDDVAYSYHIIRFRLRSEWNLLFRAYAFKTREFLSQAETLCAGSGTRYVISQKQFRSMTVSVPTLLEQTAIANILFDMDSEIKNLEKKRDKYIMVKQGMMQQLLTGKIRIYGNN